MSMATASLVFAAGASSQGAAAPTVRLMLAAATTTTTTVARTRATIERSSQLLGEPIDQRYQGRR
ncbi:hypothetical protein HU200_007066 [Digitaria exilis]|uniref:Uncharacterized protein n=1 Tax=Digitaria exilis TaxID=1010633 RepID=A0A835BKQ2_9POAL|nr:hypothetical protein HU200_033762 [Digitaria exilis]KAF8768974.1 hypothetical protein HU200_007066 [Digitaria exilis]